MVVKGSSETKSAAFFLSPKLPWTNEFDGRLLLHGSPQYLMDRQVPNQDLYTESNVKDEDVQADWNSANSLNGRTDVSPVDFWYRAAGVDWPQIFNASGPRNFRELPPLSAYMKPQDMLEQALNSLRRDEIEASEQLRSSTSWHHPDVEQGRLSEDEIFHKLGSEKDPLHETVSTIKQFLDLRMTASTAAEMTGLARVSFVNYDGYYRGRTDAAHLEITHYTVVASPLFVEYSRE